MGQEIQKKQKRKKGIYNLQENCKMQEKISLIFLENEFFRIGVMYSKQKKNQKKTNFFEYIENESKGFNYDLFREYLNFETPTQLAKKIIRNKR